MIGIVKQYYETWIHFHILNDEKKILFNLFRHFSFPPKNKLKAFKKKTHLMLVQIATSKNIQPHCASPCAENQTKGTK